MISRDILDLTSMLSKSLENKDVRYLFEESLKETDIPWDSILDTYQSSYEFPKNVVRLAIASDCINILTKAIRVVSEVGQDEIDVLYSLTQPLWKILRKLSRYDQFGTYSKDRTVAFLQMHLANADWFGGHEHSSTYFLGVLFCRQTSLLTRDKSAIELYSRILQNIISDVFGGEPRDANEVEFMDRINKMLQEFWKRPENC